MSRIYVIGDKETGVLFVLLDPLRVALVPRAEIEAYAVRTRHRSGKRFRRRRSRQSMV